MTVPAPRTLDEVTNGLGVRDGFVLSPWRERWAEVLAAAWADPEIARWNPVPPEPTVAYAASWIRGSASQNEASIGIDVVIVDEATSAPAGEIGLQVDPAQGIAEVGFWLAAAFRGRGVGATLLAFAEDLAEALELAGLVALVDPDNSAAIGLCQSKGWPELPTKSDRRAFAYRVIS